MAKFKKNDLITDGHSTLWVTDVTDTDYEFTEQSFNKFSRPIEVTDANFRLWETKKIWHKPDEPIEDDEQVLIGYETGSICLKRKYITRWAYIKDLIHL